jgi:hypothetical protein
MKLPKAVRHDLALKIVALGLAIFLWVTIAERREVELITDLPLRYTNMAPDMVFADEVPREAKARIRGRGKLLRWKLGDVYFAIDLSPAGEGIVTHVVSPSEAVIPPNKEYEVIEVLEPKAIRVELDNLVTRTLPPGPVLKGDLPEDRIMLGVPMAEPGEIVVAGAERIVDTLTAVRTEAVDVGQLAKRGRVTAKVDLSGLPFVTSDVTEVVVTARIDSRKELGIPSVPIEPVSAKPVKAIFTPDSLDIVISGAASQVDSLDPQDLKLRVNVANLPRGQLVFTPVIRDGSLYFEVRPVGKDTEPEQVFEVRAGMESPYDFDLISAAPEEIGFVQR